MIKISTAVNLIVLAFIAGLLSTKAFKLTYYYIKSIQRSKRQYRKITFMTDLSKWGGE